MNTVEAINRCNCRNCFADRVVDFVFGANRLATKVSFGLGAYLLDGFEVRRLWGQESIHADPSLTYGPSAVRNPTRRSFSKSVTKHQEIASYTIFLTGPGPRIVTDELIKPFALHGAQQFFPTNLVGLRLKRTHVTR